MEIWSRIGQKIEIRFRNLATDRHRQASCESLHACVPISKNLRYDLLMSWNQTQHLTYQAIDEPHQSDDDSKDEVERGAIYS